ncbi:NUDIX domain-containing protein [Candidatus Parcubacteria bacterium]|nr:NUDIX domain-containing protein [Candidatus Parcubacteria bacterium]
MEKPNLYEVAVTAIIRKDGKYLITKRCLTKKRFPGVWTVPGGKLEMSDYADLPKDTKNAWYAVLEKTVRREVREEVGLEIANVRYVTDLITLDFENPLLVLSMMADYASGEVVLQRDEADEYAWVTLEEARGYDFIDGIYEEIEAAEKAVR